MCSDVLINRRSQVTIYLQLQDSRLSSLFGYSVAEVRLLDFLKINYPEIKSQEIIRLAGIALECTIF